MVMLRILSAGLLGSAVLLSASNALSGSKKVEFSGSRMDAIDVLAAYSADNCDNLLTHVKVKRNAENGQLIIQAISQPAPDGPCKGRQIKFFVVGYQPNRGFKGKDEGVVSYRSPPQNYSMNQTSMARSTTYKITVK